MVITSLIVSFWASTLPKKTTQTYSPIVSSHQECRSLKIQVQNGQNARWGIYHLKVLVNCSHVNSSVHLCTQLRMCVILVAHDCVTEWREQWCLRQKDLAPKKKVICKVCTCFQHLNSIMGEGPVKTMSEATGLWRHFFLLVLIAPHMCMHRILRSESMERKGEVQSGSSRKTMYQLYKAKEWQWCSWSREHF